MKHYLMITLIRAEEQLPEYHDLYLDAYKQQCARLYDFGQSLNAAVLLQDGTNDIVFGDSYARIEYNFSLENDQKTRLIGLIRPFFGDGKLNGREMDEVNTLKAVRFLKTDGELVTIS